MLLLEGEYNLIDQNVLESDELINAPELKPASRSEVALRGYCYVISFEVFIPKKVRGNGPYGPGSPGSPGRPGKPGGGT